MLQSVLCLNNLIKSKSYYIDFPLFRLHYQVTTCLLLGFCLILSAKVLFGDPIDCKSRTAGSHDFYDQVCYSLGTYTDYMIEVEEFDGRHQKINEPYRLLKRMFSSFNVTYKPHDKYVSSGVLLEHPTGRIVYSDTLWHRYYNFIPIVLFLQGIFFYFPHYLWKHWEKGIISSICKQLHEGRFKNTDYTEAIQYLRNCFELNRHRSLVYKYYVCELILLLNLLIQIIALDSIFNYQFITYGNDFLHFLYYDRQIYGLKGLNGADDINNPLDFVFPKLTSCTVQLPSQSGLRPDKLEFLCALPLNILHDKFYLILWFWFVILVVVTVIQIIFDALYIIMPVLRRLTFKHRYGAYLADDNWHSSSLPELFILDLIGCNSDRVAFSTLLRKLNKEDWTKRSPSVAV